MRFSSLTVVMDNRAMDGFRSSPGHSLLLEGGMALLNGAGPSGEGLPQNLACCRAELPLSFAVLAAGGRVDSEEAAP